LSDRPTTQVAVGIDSQRPTTIVVPERILFPMRLSFLSPAPDAPQDPERSKSELVDEAMECYVDWREECAAVESAYGRWSSASPEGAELPYAAYSAALDREQSAAGVYRRALERLARVC
jgi:hypothetical protein